MQPICNPYVATLAPLASCPSQGPHPYNIGLYRDNGTEHGNLCIEGFYRGIICGVMLISLGGSWDLVTNYF